MGGESRIALDEWQRWLGPVFGDGHPRMRREYFDQLSEARRWMFSRVWPGTAPALEQASENFRYVAQDLQLTLEQYPHEGLRDSGWVAPQRFYNDSGWARQIGDHARLDDMYEWSHSCSEDLAIELTRAANLVCEAVRQTIDPRYRLKEGLVVLESGPYMDLMTRLHRPQYRAEDGRHQSRPAEFLVDREQRDEYRGTGDVPAGLRLPERAGSEQCVGYRHGDNAVILERCSTCWPIRTCGSISPKMSRDRRSSLPFGELHHETRLTLLVSQLLLDEFERNRSRVEAGPDPEHV